MVQNWSGTGLELVRNWSGTGLEVVQNWSGTGSELVWNWSETGLELVCNWFQAVVILIYDVITIRLCLLTGKWSTRFGQSGTMETFRLESGAPLRVPMMQQGNYPVKMGVDSELSCTVSFSYFEPSY